MSAAIDLNSMLSQIQENPLEQHDTSPMAREEHEQDVASATTREDEEQDIPSQVVQEDEERDASSQADHEADDEQDGASQEDHDRQEQPEQSNDALADAPADEGEQQLEQQLAEEALRQQDDGEASQVGEREDVLSCFGGKKRKGAPGDELSGERKPRWHYGEKSFDDITMKDVEALVRRCNMLERKVEANAEAVNQLKELQSEKKAIEKQVVQTSGREVVARAKSCIAKQLLAQMSYDYAWNDELKVGRSVIAYLPNVSPELLAGLGGSASCATKKFAYLYFDQPVVKTVPKVMRKDERPAGNSLTLGQFVTLKFIKCSSMLEVTCTYKYGGAGKGSGGRGRGRGKGRGKSSKKGLAAESEDFAEEEFDAVDNDGETSAATKLGRASLSASASIAIGGQ